MIPDTVFSCKIEEKYDIVFEANIESIFDIRDDQVKNPLIPPSH